MGDHKPVDFPSSAEAEHGPGYGPKHRSEHWPEHWKDSLVVLVAHGSETTPGAAQLVEAHAEELRACGIFSEVRATFLRSSQRSPDTVQNFTQQNIYIVPYMISDGYSAETLIPASLELSGLSTGNVPRGDRGNHGEQQRIHICQSIGTHVRVSHEIIRQIKAITHQWGLMATETVVVVAAHGTKRHQGNNIQANNLVRLITRGSGIDDAFAVFLEEPPYVSDWKSQTGKPNIIVVPYLMTPGSHAITDVPGAFGLLDAGVVLEESMALGQVFGPWPREGHRIWYLPVVGSYTGLCEVMIERIAQQDREHGTS